MRRIVVFGAGNAGKDALSFLGEKNVWAFADNNKNSQSYLGKNVISFEELKQLYMHVYIVVASYDHYDAICKQLDSNGINYYWVLPRPSKYPFSYMLFNIEKRFEYRDLFKAYYLEDKENIILYCTSNELVIILIELEKYGILNSIKKIIIKDIVLKDEWSRALLTESIEQAEDERWCLLIATPIIYRKQEELEKYLDYDIVDLYNFHWLVPDYRHPELENFKNIHKGKRCFLIGNGPSLRMEDLQTLYDNKEICFAANKIYKAFTNTDWRPDYYCVSDTDIYFNNFDDINNLSFPCKFFNDMVLHNNYLDGSNINIVQGNYIHLALEEYYPNMPRFSEDISINTFYGHTVLYDLLIPIAVYMGFEKIYLLGVDNTYNGHSITSNKGHFCSDYFNEKEKKLNKEIDVEFIFEQTELAYQKAQKVTKGMGIHIYNASRGGNLEAFIRTDFDSLFNHNSSFHPKSGHNI
jgi:uncharacterized Rossmann fold enzyme